MNSNTVFLIQFIAFWIGCGLLLIAIYIIQYKIRMYYKLKRVNENLYNMKYLWLKNIVHSYARHRDNYNYLKTQLMQLGQMKYKDHERTSVLTVEFFRRFERFAKDEVMEGASEDEFSPSQVFSEFLDN